MKSRQINLQARFPSHRATGRVPAFTVHRSLFTLYPPATSETPQLPAPLITLPISEPYTSHDLFTLSCENAAAAIYYTLDGSTPTASSTLYTAPFAPYQVGTITIKAIAILSGFLDSDITEETVTLITFPLPTPIMSPFTNVWHDSFTANWEAVTGATGYLLDVSTTADFSSFVSGYESLPVSGTSHFITGLAHNTSYYTRVMAIGPAAASPHSSATITVTLYSMIIEKRDTGTGRQTMRLGNSQDFTIYISTGAIVSVSDGAVAPDGKSAVVSAIADLGSADYRTITFEAMGSTMTDVVTMTNIDTLHRLEKAVVANGFYPTFSGAMPANLTYLYLVGLHWTYSGALPSALILLHLSTGNIYWTFSGAMPANLTYLSLVSSTVSWSYSGALPARLTLLYLNGNNINWSHTGSLPPDLTHLILNGPNIDWSGLEIGLTPNMTQFKLLNYRLAKMSSSDMASFLNALSIRSGALPNTLTINDYADAASPPQVVLDAVAALKLAKPNVTTVNLGA